MIYMMVKKADLSQTVFSGPPMGRPNGRTHTHTHTHTHTNAHTHIHPPTNAIGENAMICISFKNHSID